MGNPSKLAASFESSEQRFKKLLASLILLVACWPLVSQAEDVMPLDDLAHHYSDLYAGRKGDFAVALPTHRSVKRLDGSLASLTYVDGHLLAINGAIYFQGWEAFPFYEVQQAVIGASAYVNKTLVDLGKGSVQVIALKINVPYDFGDAAFGMNAGLQNDANQVFPTDCFVSQLLLLGETSHRIADAAETFLNGGTVPFCTWYENL